MNNLDRREQVRRQLEQRRQVLAEWVETGLSNLPEGTTLPTSLNQVRLWDDSRLEISRIGSPASCTTTHRVHGPLVRAIDTLLRDLARQRPAPRKAKKTREAELKRRLAESRRCLLGAANRYAVLRSELDETKLQLRVAGQSLEALQQENGKLRNRIRNLEAQLARRSVSGTVTSIDSLRRDPP